MSVRVPGECRSVSEPEKTGLGEAVSLAGAGQQRLSLKKLLAAVTVLMGLSLLALLYSLFKNVTPPGNPDKNSVEVLAASAAKTEDKVDDLTAAAAARQAEISPASDGFSGVQLTADQTGRHNGPVEAAPVRNSDEGEAGGAFPVYICGEVKQPGVVRVKSGSYLEQAISACGGFTEQADRQAVNLAMEMRANIMVEVPAKGSESSATSRPEGYVDSLAEAGAGESGADKAGARGKININRATPEELTQIPGVGEATANRILSYRRAAGRFNTREELMQVPGIKEGKYEAMKDLITVD